MAEPVQIRFTYHMPHPIRGDLIEATGSIWVRLDYSLARIPQDFQKIITDGLASAGVLRIAEKHHRSIRFTYAFAFGDVTDRYVDRIEQAGDLFADPHAADLVIPVSLSVALIEKERVGNEPIVFHDQPPTSPSALPLLTFNRHAPDEPLFVTQPEILRLQFEVISYFQEERGVIYDPITVGIANDATPPLVEAIVKSAILAQPDQPTDPAAPDQTAFNVRLWMMREGKMMQFTQGEIWQILEFDKTGDAYVEAHMLDA